MSDTWNKIPCSLVYVYKNSVYILRLFSCLEVPRGAQAGAYDSLHRRKCMHCGHCQPSVPGPHAEGGKACHGAARCCWLQGGLQKPAQRHMVTVRWRFLFNFFFPATNGKTLDSECCNQCFVFGTLQRWRTLLHPKKVSVQTSFSSCRCASEQCCSTELVWVLFFYIRQIFPGDRGLPVCSVGGLCCAVARIFIGWTLYRSTARFHWPAAGESLR